jgi:quercetin dioxygenase-like cupin family protein
MQVTRNSIDTTIQPSERFTGEVYADVVTTASDESHVKASHVHFSPGSRTAWHSHPKGQTIYVTEGVGLCQRRGDPIEVIRPGDRVFFEPDEDHWHGAAPNRFMTHLAIVQVTEEGKSAAWGAHVTAEEYSGSRAGDSQSGS